MKVKRKGRMKSGFEDANQAFRYLLGEMPERERSEFEDRCFMYDAFYESVLSAEDDLIDCYVRGELPAARQRLFENRYFSVARLSRRVDVARLLQQRSAEPRPESLSIGSRLGRRIPVAWLAVAAALVLMSSASWWLVHRATAPSSAVVHRQNPSAQKQGSEAKSTTSYVAFILRADAERTAATQPVLLIPPNTDQVRLEVRLERTGRGELNVVLRTVEGTEVWRTSGIPGQQHILNLTIPASLFQTADYILTVHGMRGIIGEYPLSVRKQV